VVAGIVFVIGILGIAMGFSVATGYVVEPEPGYFLGSKTSGEWIDRRIYRVFFAICLGVLTDISKSLAKGDKGE